MKRKKKKRGLLGGGGGVFILWAGVSGNGCWNLNPTWQHSTCCTRETRDMFARVMVVGGVNERWVFLVFVESRNERLHEERRRKKKKSARWKPRHQIWTTWEWEWFHTDECLYGFDASDSNTTSDEGGETRLATRWSKSWVGRNNSGVQSVPLLRVHIHVITWIVPVLMEAARPIYMWLFTQHAKLKPLTDRATGDDGSVNASFFFKARVPQSKQV